ncbi:uracil-DNA glycosylase [Pyruvatibacter mobilis]|uniref:Type-5 uracil-DNA glycosylase n=1 Tax=Pyruvatibacter mobilis TaxID=1712261 RepID=A0A845QB66_9HYPH|nr:uracil-DNA glycosylase [Pyruvatibacter mobilis]NBG95792.1 uracil-DNA glycosylase [Pyruvatibacter mobilis]QJD74937.1 uracil-DNA glycosylase [Pyruvatibacter mobilis]GGD11331.1 uracil-DNA glycosylase [Pyruvatibacter mobilis]
MSRRSASIAPDIPPAPEPPADCPHCPRLVAFRQDNQAKFPDGHNGPVVSFGDDGARLLIVGLAPGLQGANKTARPFTGDYAGDLLYATIEKFGFSEGTYQARPDDGLKLRGAMISNAVRCVPPQNKPTPAEINTCRAFLRGRIDALPSLTHMLALGRIAHESVLRMYGRKLKDHPFAHGARHELGGVTLFDSYHCSRYNTNTGRLTTEMFEAVFAQITDDMNASR